MGPSPQPIRLVNQQIDPLSPLQHPLNIIRHDPAHTFDILLHVCESILFARLRRPERDHQALELVVEIRRTVRWQRSKIRRRRIIFFQELFLDFDEEAEWDSAPKGCRGDNKIGKAAGGRISVGMI